jgi:hypothetical protein
LVLLLQLSCLRSPAQRLALVPVALKQVNTLFDELPWAQASRLWGTELNGQLQNLKEPVLRPANLVQPLLLL